MTEHCVNNDTSQCQTKDATHLILTFNEFRANKTIGHTYFGERADLSFHLAADPDAPVYRLKLFVANHSDRAWNVLLYEDPHNHTSATSITTLAAKSELQVYTLREYEFSNKEEVLVFFRFGEKLFDISQEELCRLWTCLNNLHELPVFADMTVSNEAGVNVPAHRAVIAAASQVLHNSVALLKPAELEEPNACCITEEEADDGTVAEQSNNTNLNEAFAAFASAVIKIEKPDNVSALTENLKEAIEEALDIQIPANNSTEIVIQQPNPNRFNLAINGLRSKKDFEVFLRYAYTGKFVMKPKVLDDDHVEFIHKLDDILAVIYMFNMTLLVEIIESLLQTQLKEHTAVDLLQLANQYDLGKLKFKVVQYLRRPSYSHILKGIKDPMFYKCVISYPSHKNQNQFHSRFMMELEQEYIFYLCGLRFFIEIYKSMDTASNDLVLNVHSDLKKILCFNFFEIALISEEKADVKKICLEQEVLIGSMLFFIMPWVDFLDQKNGYVQNNGAMVEFFIEANTDFLSM